MVLYLYACHAISWALAGAVSTASLAVTKRNLEKNLTPLWLNQSSGSAIANFAGPIAGILDIVAICMGFRTSQMVFLADLLSSWQQLLPNAHQDN